MVKCDIPKYRLENWKIRYNFLYVNSESGVVIFTNSASLALCLPQLKVRFDVGIFASRSPYWRHVFYQRWFTSQSECSVAFSFGKESARNTK